MDRMLQVGLALDASLFLLLLWGMVRDVVP